MSKDAIKHLHRLINASRNEQQKSVLLLYLAGMTIQTSGELVSQTKQLLSEFQVLQEQCRETRNRRRPPRISN